MKEKNKVLFHTLYTSFLSFFCLFCRGFSIYGAPTLKVPLGSVQRNIPVNLVLFLIKTGDEWNEPFFAVSIQTKIGL